MSRNYKSRNQEASIYVPPVNRMVEEIKLRESEDLELARKISDLKKQMSSREAAWAREQETMQGPESERLQEELEKVERELRLKDDDFKSLRTRFQRQQSNNLKIRRDLTKKCIQVNEMKKTIRQRDQVIHRSMDEIIELKTTATRALQNETEWQSGINAMKDELRREQAEKEASLKRIEELETQVQVSKEKQVTKHHEMEDGNIPRDQVEDSNEELKAKLLAIRATILQSKTKWQAEVDALEESLNHEQAEKESSLKKIKALERLVEATEEKWVTNHHEMEEAIIQKDKVISTVEDINWKLKAKLHASEAKMLQSKTEWQTKVDTLEDNLRREQAEKKNSFRKIKELETLVEATEEKWVTKLHEMEDRNIQKDQVIATVDDSNQMLKAKLHAIEAKMLQSKAEWQTKVDTLEDNLRCEQAEKESSFMKIKELEKLFGDNELMWATKHTASAELATKLQALALMTDKDKTRIKKEQKKVRKEAEKALERELKEKKKQEKKGG